METYELIVNGVPYPVTAPVDRNLVTVLRENVGLTGTKEGCDDCECGACMVLVDGRPVNSCSYLAVQAQGREVTTVEGLAVGDDGAVAGGGVERGDTGAACPNALGERALGTELDLELAGEELTRKLHHQSFTGL